MADLETAYWGLVASLQCVQGAKPLVKGSMDPPIEARQVCERKTAIVHYISVLIMLVAAYDGKCVNLCQSLQIRADLQQTFKYHKPAAIRKSVLYRI